MRSPQRWQRFWPLFNTFPKLAGRVPRSACLTRAPGGIRALPTQLFPIPHAAGWAAALVSAALPAAEDKVKAKLARGCCLQIEMKTNR